LGRVVSRIKNCAAKQQKGAPFPSLCRLRQPGPNGSHMIPIMLVAITFEHLPDQHRVRYAFELLRLNKKLDSGEKRLEHGSPPE
jgi:hypothetical protein